MWLEFVARAVTRKRTCGILSLCMRHVTSVATVAVADVVIVG